MGKTVLKVKKPQRSSRKLLIKPFLLFLSLVVVFSVFILSYRNILIRLDRVACHRSLVTQAQRLEAVLVSRISQTRGIRAFIETNLNRGLSEEEILAYFKNLVQEIPGIRNVSYAPMGIQTYIYPKTEALMVFGHNLLADTRSDVAEDIARTLATSDPVISAPYELRQGGMGLVVRQKISRNGRFEGLVAIVIDLPVVMKIAGFDSSRQGTMALALRRNPGTVLWGESRLFNLDPVLAQVSLSGGYFELAAFPVRGWGAPYRKRWNILAFVGLGLALITSMGFYRLEMGKQALTRNIRMETDRSRQTQASLDALVSIVPDGITICNASGQIVFSNSQAQKTLHLGNDSLFPTRDHRWETTRLDGSQMELGLDPITIVAERGQPSFAIEISTRFEGGIPMYLSLNSTLLEQGEEDEALVVTTIKDITTRVNHEKELDEKAHQLHRSMWDAVDLVARLVEQQDPYTAGHQKRVAELSMHIAKQMGYSSAEVESIRMAATLHDVGKANIPQEFLTKPGKLTPLEFKIIQTHPELGYELLRHTDFPGQVAEMVYQHHERMDGSGYPQGLSGQAILHGARIIAVADVVEAMASFRPYRPSLGLDAALQEIRKGKGIAFDSDVVEATLQVFDSGFLWEMPPESEPITPEVGNIRPEPFPGQGDVI